MSDMQANQNHNGLNKNNMDILGYSERGIINSLFYEIKYSQNSINLLKGLLGEVEFPNNTRKKMLLAKYVIQLQMQKY